MSYLLLSLPRPFQKHHPLFYTCGPNWEKGRGLDADMPDDQGSHSSSDTSWPAILRLLSPFSGKRGPSNDGEVLTASESWTRPRVGSGKRTTHSHPGSRSPKDLRLSRVPPSTLKSPVLPKTKLDTIATLPGVTPPPCRGVGHVNHLSSL